MTTLRGLALRWRMGRYHGACDIVTGRMVGNPIIPTMNVNCSLAKEIYWLSIDVG